MIPCICIFFVVGTSLTTLHGLLEGNPSVLNIDVNDTHDDHWSQQLGEVFHGDDFSQQSGLSYDGTIFSVIGY